jgi:hypothetical protein
MRASAVGSAPGSAVKQRAEGTARIGSGGRERR